MFATTNVVRETYLALALSESYTLRVDPYLGLHPDLFEIPGRGSYINSNPGASFVGAIPLFVARPAMDALFRWKPSLVAPKPAAAYDDTRSNRSKFMNASRARGLDVKLGLAALLTAIGLMAPLAALVSVLLARFLEARGETPMSAARISLLYALGTPLLFRSAFLNQNILLAHATLGAWMLMVGLRPRTAGSAVPFTSLAATGGLLGFGLLLDYSAAPLLVTFGLWILWSHRGEGTLGAVRRAAVYSSAAFAVIALLFAYQWAAFGSPWFPAQHYMPATPYSVLGWNGFTRPTVELLVGNLFDPRYGLLAFSPLLALAFATPFVRRRAGDMTGAEYLWMCVAVTGLYTFSSANQFANLQWNTGVRYMVPAAPLLFLAAVPALRALPRTVTAPIVAASVLISLAVSMTREGVLDAFRVLSGTGPTLPIFIVLEKMASGYPALDFPAWLPSLVLAACTLPLAWWWRPSRA